MNHELTDIYNNHLISDVFTRYHQNTRLLEILALNISGDRGSHHLSIGFSGRLSLFDALAESLTVVNLSAAQIELGISLQKQLVELFGAPQGYFWPLVREDIDCQMSVLRNCKRTPVIPKNLESLCFDITEEMNRLPSATYTSVSMIDVLLHVPHVEPIVEHLQRILTPHGKAIVTIYPPGGEGHLNDFVLTSPDLWGGTAEQADHHAGYYSADGGLLDLQAIKKVLEQRAHIPVETQKRFWLDLPGVFLHRESRLIAAAEKNGLHLQLSEQVSGGMFPVIRQVLVLGRRPEDE